jgi:hypothetical protein
LRSQNDMDAGAAMWLLGWLQWAGVTVW